MKAARTRSGPLAGERRPLGATGLPISAIGFGGWAAGGSEWSHGWSGQRDEDSVAALERALALGVNWIDTAAVYGFGHSEDLIGRVLEERRERPYVFTKCGPRADDSGRIRSSLDPADLRSDVEGSLRRLRTTSLDLLQIHRPDPPGEIERAWETLVALKEEGLVRHLGVSNFSVSEIRRLERIAPVETIQPQYSLLRRDAETALLPFAQQTGKGVLVYSPLASGLLTGTMNDERLGSLPPTDWRRTDPRFAPSELSRAAGLVELLRPMARRHGASVAEVAVAWTIRHPAVSGTIVGFRTSSQVDDLVRAASITLASADIAALETYGT
jgi:aryl-alcohol dehydrogenase-like predicted oxidoreductase